MRTNPITWASIALFTMLAGVLSTQAAGTNTWTSADNNGSWTDAANWSLGSAPAAGDTALFTNLNNTLSTITLDKSYPDSGSAVVLGFNYGANLTILGASPNELYVNGLTVGDANTYTLNIAKDGTDNNSGTMPQSGAIWNIGPGGTLIVQTCFGAKSGVTGGNINKTGAGTLNLGSGTTNNTSQYLQLNVQAGLAQLGFSSGTTVNGISGISAGATVQVATSNLNATILSSTSYNYATGVAGVAGTFDLNGNNQRISALGGTATGLVTNGGINNATLTLGVGGYLNRSETSSTFAGVIADGAAGNISLSVNSTNAAFVETLSGQNTYSGSTTIARGTVKAGVASVAGVSGALGKNSAVIMGTAAAANLNLNGFNTQIGSLTGGGATGGSVTNGGATLTIGGDNTSPAAYAGIIYGTGGVIKTGTGTLTLAGTNVYTGNTTVNAGVLALSGSGSVASGIVLAGGTTLIPSPMLFTTGPSCPSRRERRGCE